MNNEEISAINKATKALYEDVKSSLDSTSTNAITEYLSVGEPALAVELLLYCVERENLALSTMQNDALYALAKRMNIDFVRMRDNWTKS